jgi:hypothetical protein
MSSFFQIGKFLASSEVLKLLMPTIRITVHPVPAPPSTKLEVINKVNDGGNNQKLILFNRGNAISGAPIINGTIQFSFSLSFNKDWTISSSFFKDALHVVSEDFIPLSIDSDFPADCPFPILLFI